VEYALLKYILARLLYEKWDIKYLFNKYHDKIINNLRNSKFNEYVKYFTIFNNGIYYKDFF
jgi:hypothetical protein